jgi:hypothetical protein
VIVNNNDLRVIRDSNPSGMRVWAMPPDESLRSAEVIAEGEL